MTTGQCRTSGEVRPFSHLATLVAPRPMCLAAFFWVIPRSRMRFFRWSAKVLGTQRYPGFGRSCFRVTVQEGNAGMRVSRCREHHVRMESGAGPYM